ncbi:hypothetical protein K503DRAFT_699132, partial [Rhizopogon vinicolor AM-OR11-026]
MSHHPISVSSGKFNLDVSGVAAFFGGDAAIKAMKTFHLYKDRRWTGWYNAPGSFAVAKYIGPIANSRLWHTIFLVEQSKDPETVFGLDGRPGPKYIAFQSGTIIDKTTHAAYFVTQRSKEECSVITVRGRTTQPITLSVVQVPVTDTPYVNYSARVGSKESPTLIVKVRDHQIWLARIPMSASLIACILCAYNRDWYCLAMIFLGIIANGLTCLLIGSASLVLKGVQSAYDARPGDGILVDDSSNHIVILKGAERDVNWVTKGKFRLEYLPSVWKHMEIGLCGLLLSIQSFLQLLLIPQGTTFGQIMFLSSFVISWAYNLYFSSLYREKIQQDLLLETLKVTFTSKFKLGTRTIAAVFTTLVLRPHSSTKPQPPSQTEPKPSSTNKFLKYILPNETAMWDEWREHV